MNCENTGQVKKMKTIPNSIDIKTCVLNSNKPLVFKNILSWDLLKWSVDDWIMKLGNTALDVRVGSAQCTKVPQWETNSEVSSVFAKELFNETNNQQAGKWMYFDYKHMKQHLESQPELLELISWADFGFSDKTGKDSTIWIGTKGAYTPTHMDSYGCNIVAQVYGRKLWVMFPPSMTEELKPTRVPYEESSVFSNIHLGCGLNLPDNIKQAWVVELGPGDVLVVPKHWWHYVENLNTAISINMWIPKESDHCCRLEEALVRYFVGMTIKNWGMDEDTSLLNPNEIDLSEEPVDLRQITWCLQQVLFTRVSSVEPEDTATDIPCVSPVPCMSYQELKHLLLSKCGCADVERHIQTADDHVTVKDVINAFCHPQVIAKVAEILLTTKST